MIKPKKHLKQFSFQRMGPKPVTLTPYPWDKGATPKIHTFNWGKAFRDGADLAKNYVRSGTTIGDEVIAWALLCVATEHSRAYAGPPRTGYPVKSTMPDAPDEISFWQKMASFVRGELDEAPAVDWKAPLPSAEEITRADKVLHVWHHGVTLSRDRKKAVYLKACGAKDGKIRRVTGISAQDIKNAKRRALSEMLSYIKKHLDD